MISIIENSNKFQKTRFWKEKLVEDVVTIGPMAHATLVNTNESQPLMNLSSWKTRPQ
jgi:hypothetical protein